MTAPKTDRSALVADLERARTDFRHLLTTVREDEWVKPTSGTSWNNEQLLFHMVFGYMVVQRLLVLLRVVGRLPGRASRAFAWLLDTCARPFHRINYYGSCLAAKVYNRNRMGAKLDRVVDALQRSIHRAPDSAFGSGMYFPTRWDPYFREYMTLTDVYRYPGRHYDHHRRQLNIGRADLTD